MLCDLKLNLASTAFNNLLKNTFLARQRVDIAKQSVSGMDAGQEPPRKGSRRLCVQYRL